MQPVTKEQAIETIRQNMRRYAFQLVNDAVRVLENPASTLSQCLSAGRNISWARRSSDWHDFNEELDAHIGRRGRPIVPAPVLKEAAE